MNQIKRIMFTPTGEVRPPRQDEYYHHPHGGVTTACVDHTVDSQQVILTRHIEYEGDKPVLPEWVRKGLSKYLSLYGSPVELARHLGVEPWDWRADLQPTPMGKPETTTREKIELVKTDIGWCDTSLRILADAIDSIKTEMERGR